MQLLNIILFWVFFGLLASHFAKKRGRYPLAWFFIGLTLGVFGVLLLFILPIATKKKAPPPAKPTAPPKPKQHEAYLKMWYFLDPSHAQQGPYEFPDLIKKWKEKGFSEGSYIWGEGMKEWRRLSELPEIIQEFDRT